jgi:beta-glucanase (GH16 family)
MTFRFLQIFILLGFFVGLSACSQVTPQPSATAAPTPTQIIPTPTLPEEVPALAEADGWQLVWQDEFDGDAIDPKNWSYDIGGGGWGNNEWEYYTNRSENAYLDDGKLIIEAREEKFQGRSYTSARLKTQGLQTFTYGRIEARMKLPSGKGIWPAFWMLGEDIYSKGWPACGEIDIMENIGNPNTTYGTLHGPGYSGGGGIVSSYTVQEQPLDEEFHVYAIEWEPAEIRWYLDDALFFKVINQSVPGEWVFDHPLFVILNLAVGGNWPGYPDESTPFPQQYIIDYVRVYNDPNLNLEDLGNGEVHIAEINMEIAEVESDKQATVYVTVIDQDEQPVENAIVTAGWLGVITGADKSATTNADGIAGPFTAKKSLISKEFSFCVVDISGGQYIYNKDLNTISCQALEP